MAAISPPSPAAAGIPSSSRAMPVRPLARSAITKSSRVDNLVASTVAEDGFDFTGFMADDTGCVGGRMRSGRGQSLRHRGRSGGPNRRARSHPRRATPAGNRLLPAASRAHRAGVEKERAGGVQGAGDPLFTGTARMPGWRRTGRPAHRPSRRRWGWSACRRGSPSDSPPRRHFGRRQLGHHAARGEIAAGAAGHRLDLAGAMRRRGPNGAPPGHAWGRRSRDHRYRTTATGCRR